MNKLSIKELMKNRKKKGFTLIELIIVIAIIAILAAIAIPKFGEIRENANVKADIANAKSIQTAVTAGVANGDINLNKDDVDLTIVVSGQVPTPKAKEAKGGTFKASVDENGDVTVTANDIQVLPNPEDPYKESTPDSDEE